MNTPDDPLHSLNLEIAQQESDGNHAFFDDLLAPQFAMRRADLHTFVDRPTFLAGVAESAPRTTADLQLLEQSETMAVVRCTVAMPRDGELRRFTNVRVFVRAAVTDRWKLLAWTNEPAGPGERTMETA